MTDAQGQTPMRPDAPEAAARVIRAYAPTSLSAEAASRWGSRRWPRCCCAPR